MNGFGAPNIRYVAKAPAYLADEDVLEFYPMGDTSYASAADAYYAWQSWRDVARNFNRWIVPEGPPHIFVEHMHFADRWGWRHWVAPAIPKKNVDPDPYEWGTTDSWGYL